MTVARRTKRRNRLEKQTQEVITDLLNGMTQAEVARKYAVATSSISDFAVRHAEEITSRAIAVERQAADYDISAKVWRIAQAQADYNRVSDWVDEHSLSERTVRYDKDGNEVGETVRLRKDALDTLRQYRREVAEELGALPRPDQNINIRALMAVRQVDGIDLDKLG